MGWDSRLKPRPSGGPAFFRPLRSSVAPSCAAIRNENNLFLFHACPFLAISAFTTPTSFRRRGRDSTIPWAARSLPSGWRRNFLEIEPAMRVVSPISVRVLTRMNWSARPNWPVKFRIARTQRGPGYSSLKYKPRSPLQSRPPNMVRQSPRLPPDQIRGNGQDLYLDTGPVIGKLPRCKWEATTDEWARP